MGDIRTRSRVRPAFRPIHSDCLRDLSADQGHYSDLSALLPHLYGLLPLPAASSALVEVLSESLFKFGKGAKILTEPLLAWFTGPGFQAALAESEGGQYTPSSICLFPWLTMLDSSEEIVGLTKLLAALVEHSSEWFIAKIGLPEVQTLLGLILRLTGWEGTPSVDEQISEVRPGSTFPCISRVGLGSELTDTAHTTYIPDDPGSNHGL